MTNLAPSWDLFDPPPRIKIAAPSALGSKTSEDSADAIEPFRRKSWRQILYTLAQLSPEKFLSREEIASKTGIKECSVCGRIDELRPLWIEVIPDAVIAKSKRKVDGYRITDAGRNLFKRGAAA